ncbi:MAG: Gx transporter family protein [Defluviitaleaceae bacterium]|nr:Gx transporter family protein [Defluviitaleaceae bacterium]
MMNTAAKKVAYYGIFTTLAIIASYIERLVAVPIAVPGIKLGLANVIVIIMLYASGARSAFAINVLRMLLVGFLFGSVTGIIYSLSGGIASYIIMVTAKKTKAFGIVGVSVFGGVFHNIGQISMAAVVVNNVRLFYYAPVLIIFGVLTGIIIGFTAGYTLRHVQVIRRI